MENNVIVGPFKFEEKHPEEDRVPKVPDHVSGPDVRLLVGEAKTLVGSSLIEKESGFVTDLSHEDRETLRGLTRRAHSRRNPGDWLSDKNCDQVIEMLGPEVAVKNLRGD